METHIYRRHYDGKHCVEVLMYPPYLDMAELDKLRDRGGMLPEYIERKWITVGVFGSFISAKRVSKRWRKN